MPKRTFQPNRRHRAKVHGFRARMKSKAGAAVPAWREHTPAAPPGASASLSVPGIATDSPAVSR